MQCYFTNLFTSVGNRDLGEALSVVERLVTVDMNRLLVAPACDEEIRATVFQLGALKAPGADGFPDFFYQTYWHEVGEHVI